MEKNIGTIKEYLGDGSINVFGLPFSGKDTVGKHLADDLGAVLLSSGDILRSAQESDDDLSSEMNSGKLADTDKFREIVLPYFSNSRLANLPLVLSSVGRWSGEEIPVQEALSKAQHELKAVIWLDISEAEVWQRWEAARTLADRGQRGDDNDEETLSRRLSEFSEKTLPVLTYYDRIGLLIKINGIGTREEVYNRVIEGLVSHVLA